MKFLYITAEHVSGTLSLFKAEHERRGDECRFVTFWHSRWDFDNDICLNLPLMPDRSWVRALRRLTGANPHRAVRRTEDSLPLWKPGPIARAAFSVRDFLNWPDVEHVIHREQLYEFDVLQLDGGLDFTRDARFAREWAARGKPIACFYHGSDMRSRGLIPAVNDLAALHLTSEWDLLEMDSRLHYLYLPHDTTAYPEREWEPHEPIRICHAARNPLKGTRFVEQSVKSLRADHALDLVLLRDLPHAEALRRKADCDIFVDQLTNEGGWGYGMSSVEALAMGLPVITNIPPQMRTRLGDHPFVQADPETITSVLRKLIKDPEQCRERSIAGRAWVRERHDVRSVVDDLYHHYERLGWLTRR